MGHITQQTYNVARFSDFDRVTRGDVEAAESLMPEFYSVLFHNCNEISFSAFYANNRVEELNMNGSGIERIGGWAFKKCQNLKTVYLPSELKVIEASLFMGCEKLKDIVLPDGVIHINSKAFEGCSSLENITIPEFVSFIGDDAFLDCSKLEWINLPEGLKTICKNVFGGCSSLIDVIIPTTVTSVGADLFNDCLNLKRIYVPKSLLSKYDIDYFKCNTNAEVVSYNSIDELYEEYNSQLETLKEGEEYWGNIIRKAQTNVVTTDESRDRYRKFKSVVRTKRIAKFVRVMTNIQLKRFLKSIPRRASDANSQNDSTSNLESENVIDTKPIAAVSKGARNYSGKVRRNLIAEKKNNNK